MNDDLLRETVTQALANLHSALPHDAALESDLYFIRSELTKSEMVILAHERTIRRLEHEALKREETILWQGDRILTQHKAAQECDEEFATLKQEHQHLLADYNHLNVRNILARIMGRGSRAKT